MIDWYAVRMSIDIENRIRIIMNDDRIINYDYKWLMIDDHCRWYTKQTACPFYIRFRNIIIINIYINYDYWYIHNT